MSVRRHSLYLFIDVAKTNSPECDLLLQDDRFTYIHLRAETSLWNYADDQVHWALQDLDDRMSLSLSLSPNTRTV
jgi:hypothetical protein